MRNHPSRTAALSAVMCAACAAALAAAPEIGAPRDAAPNAKDTRLQNWPRAAWAAETKCWLVVWREGALDEGRTDIWCARVKADGTTLDPQGIRLTAAPGIKDRPAVASDGRGFLVAWSDFRNGKDWDVYAARVSGDGKALDGDGIPLAVGEHNQCQPTVTFAAGNYLAAWQGFVENAIHYTQRKSVIMEFGSYEVRGTRISPQGKVLDAGGNVLAAATAIQPCFALDTNGNAWLAFIGHLGDIIDSSRIKHFPALVRIDAAACAPQGDVSALGESADKARDFGGGGAPLSVGWLKDGSGIIAGRGCLGGTTLFRFDKDGKNAGEAVKIQNGEFRDVMAVSSLAVSGGKALLVRDWPHSPSPREKPNMGVWGRMLPTEGKIEEGTAGQFPIVADTGKDYLQSFACIGPDGAFLVVYAEPRGPEDTKVVARILK